MKKILICLVTSLAALLALEVPLCAQQLPVWGDLGNGRFRNPVIASDYSDPDVIRVGDDYYGIASTFHFSPGMVIIHSKDLVNWEIAGHVVQDITFLSPRQGWGQMDGYFRGIWAGSLRFHDGIFYCHFISPEGGWFCATAKDVRGKWDVKAMSDKNGRELRGGGWDDICPLWDDDGKCYVVASNFGKNWYPFLFRMSADGLQLLDAEIPQGADLGTNIPLIGGHPVKMLRTAEAAKLYKWNGYYYIYFSEVRNVHGNNVRVAMMRRSKDIYGPYEEKELIHSHGKAIDHEPNQGAIVDTPDGKNWYFVTHHGTGDFDGRVLSTLEVHWQGDWPLIGKDIDADGVGEMVWEAEKPLQGQKKTHPQTSDDFSGKELAPQWEWNHQPREDKWSLDIRGGFLRLYAFGQLGDGGFFKTGNVLSQRFIRWDKSEAVVKMDVRGMADGQQVGLCHFNGGKDFATAGILMRDGIKKFIWTKKTVADKTEQVIEGAALPSKIRYIFLKTKMDFSGKAIFEYSLDGKSFKPLGGVFQMSWGNYRGDRIGIYTFNNQAEKGYIDVDYFHYGID